MPPRQNLSLGNLDGASDGTGGTDTVLIQSGTGNFLGRKVEQITDYKTISPVGVLDGSLPFEDLVGPTGSQGPSGTSGRTILSGTVDPDNFIGANNDFYINISTWQIFGPKQNGLWPEGVNLIGAIGPQGPQGLQGIQGIQGIQGGKGDTGIQGIQGVQGPIGRDSGYRYGGFAVEGILGDEYLMDHTVTLAHNLPSGFFGSKASVGTPPNTTWVGTIYQNEVSVGTLTVATNGTCTFSSSNGGLIAVAIGDVMTLKAPSSPDSAIRRLRWTFEGVLQ